MSLTSLWKIVVNLRRPEPFIFVCIMCLCIVVGVGHSCTCCSHGCVVDCER